MPTVAAKEILERKERIWRSFDIVQKNEGKTEKIIVGMIMLTLGIKKSTAYEYIQAFIDTEKMVEIKEFGVPRTLWTAEGWDKEEAKKREAGFKKEEELAKVGALDGYMLEKVEKT